MDSTLAIKIMMAHNIEVIPIGYRTPFFSPDVEYGERVIGVPIVIVDVFEEYIDVLLSPSYGYGSNMNLCIDCHRFMIKKTKLLLPLYGASFIITGEVLGERPMSQNKWALKEVEKEAEGLVVRPLSGKLLPPTIPEQNGWINREWLYDISGRKRDRQMKLAELFGIKEYKNPAGGCLLTDINFSKRLRFLLGLNTRPSREELELLRFGRHFYVNDSWIIIGRNERENIIIKDASLWEFKLFSIDYPGPTGIIVRGDSLEVGARLLVRYSDAPKGMNSRVRVFKKTGESYILEVDGMPEEEIEKIRI
ncbi:MAG: tRNA 4-thiouridine(8) synthase ThiI [bacterium]